VFVSCDSARVQAEDYCLKHIVQELITLGEYATLGGHTLLLEDGPEITDERQVVEYPGDVLYGMFAPGCDSLNQARLTQEQAEELRRRAKNSSPNW
jgi:hypothetical protein